MPTNTIPMTMISKNSINGNSSHRRSRGSSGNGLLAPAEVILADGVDEVFV